ncbi:MAG: ferritin-like domain-containing protein [Alphaproteobacteria bacterium]|nr:ferritin-like domain-containing protein [Alphaproteobacteria bacterium]
MTPTHLLHRRLAEVLGPILAASLLSGCGTALDPTAEARTVCTHVAPGSTCPTVAAASESMVGTSRCTDPEEKIVEVTGAAKGSQGLQDTGGNPFDLCCYDVRVTILQGRGCVVGRPVTGPDGPIVARAVPGASWGAGGAVETRALDRADRAAAAAWWQRTALEEHASVAAFARLALELLAHGAPADLLLRTQLAGAEEVVHAQEAFALAATLGAPARPGPLALPPRAVPDLPALAVETLVEGAVNETLAAVLAAERLAVATDPAVRAALERVVADESRHAALGWAVVAWARREGGAAVDAALADVALRPPVAAAEPCIPSHGLLGTVGVARALDHAWRAVVQPALAGLSAPEEPAGAAC